MRGDAAPHPNLNHVKKSMPENNDELVRQFETHRAYLHSVAFQMLASEAEADDVVQESWLRLSRSDAAAINDLRAWLTTVVQRMCLDKLRARNARDERPLNLLAPNGEERPAEDGSGPEGALMNKERVALALAIVLDTLTPAQRVPFVLHDAFDIPFDVIARVIGKTEAAARKQASRARQIILDEAPFSDIGWTKRPDAVEAFLEAANHGRFVALMKVLSADAGFDLDDGDLMFSRSMPSLRRAPESRVEDVISRYPALFEPPITLSDHWKAWRSGAYAGGWVEAMNALAGPDASA